MKATTLAALITLTFSFSAYGQCPVPNGDFESWSDITDSLEQELTLELLHPVILPTGYISLFRLIEFALSDLIIYYFDKDTLDIDLFDGIKQVQPGADGSASALQLRGDSVLLLADVTQLFECGARPEKMTGYFRYDGAVNDSLSVIGLLLADDQLDEENAVGLARFTSAGGPGEFTKFEAAFEYNSDEVPDSAAILILATKDDMAPGDTASFVIDEVRFDQDPVSTRDQVIYDDFLITPNPVIDVAVIQAEFSRIQAVQVRDALGRVVFDRRLPFSNSFSLHHLPEGIYYATITADDRTYVQKLSKQ